MLAPQVAVEPTIPHWPQYSAVFIIEHTEKNLKIEAKKRCKCSVQDFLLHSSRPFGACQGVSIPCLNFLLWLCLLVQSIWGSCCFSFCRRTCGSCLPSLLAILLSLMDSVGLCLSWLVVGVCHMSCGAVVLSTCCPRVSYSGSSAFSEHPG